MHEVTSETLEFFGSARRRGELFQQRHNLVHAALAGNISGRGKVVLAAERGVGAVFEKEFRDLQGLVVVFLESEQRRGLPGDFCP